MNKFKKLVVMVAGIAMMSSLAACGGAEEKKPVEEQKAETEVKDNEEKKEEASDGEKVELVFWHAMGGVNGEATQELVDAFNESQDDIVVKAEYQGTYDDTITKLKAAMQADNMPDICQMYDVGTKFMMDSDHIIPVEDMFDVTGFKKDTVMDVITSYYSKDGKQYAMPFNVSTPMLYYNKDVFKAAGLDPEKAPKTYDEVLEYAKQIVESGAAPVGYSQAIYGWFFEQQIAGLASCYGNNENGRASEVTAVDFDSNGAGLKVFNMWKKLYDSGYFENYGTTTADTQTAFYSGQVGMMIESTACLKNATQSSDFEIGTGYLPKVEENDEGGVIIGGASLWLMDTKDDAKKEAAWKFIEFATTPEAQADWSMATGYFAINPEAYNTENMKAYIEDNPNFITAIKQLEDAPVNNYTAGVLSGVQTESRLLFNETMEQVYDNKLSPEEGVKELAEKVNEAIDNYNKSIQ